MSHIIDQRWHQQLQRIHVVVLTPSLFISLSFKANAKLMLALNTCIDNRLLIRIFETSYLMTQNYKNMEVALFSLSHSATKLNIYTFLIYDLV